MVDLVDMFGAELIVFVLVICQTVAVFWIYGTFIVDQNRVMI